MQLHPPVSTVFVKIHDSCNCSFHGKIPNEFKRGKFGEPTISRHQSCARYLPRHWIAGNYPLGTIIKGYHCGTDRSIFTTYVIKSVDDGWWKLEWPD